MQRSSFFAALLAVVAAASAADWLTDGGNPQRTAWQRDEKILNRENVRNLKIVWKLKLDNQPREMHSLFPPLIVGSLKTSSGPKQVAIEAGISDNLYAIDVEKGEILWHKHFESSYTPPPSARPGGPLCPGGQTATPVIGPEDAQGRRTVYAVAWDGRLRRINAADGEDLAPPAKFMPPNGKPYALNLWHNVLYSTTAQGCGGNPNLMYAYDLATQKTGTFNPGSGGMWGRTGPAIGEDGAIYTGTGDGIWAPERHIYGNGLVGAKLDPETKALELKGAYGPSNAEWMQKRDLDMQVTPAIFPFHGRELLVTGSKECRVYLVDTSNIGGADQRTPLYRSPLMCNEEVNFASAGIWGAMASWEDSKGTRWVLTPFWGPMHPNFHAPVEHGAVDHGAIVAYKVEARNGGVVLTPAWISRDMNYAEPPIIANGVVYAYGSGENTVQSTPEAGLKANTSAARIANSTHATLYALDAETGKELYSSGDQITSFVHFGGLSIANGRVYIATFDSTLYCFGLGAGMGAGK
jgi:outer membrane protein assembly factor BamB